MKQYRSLHRFGQLAVLATLLGVVAAVAPQTTVDRIGEGDPEVSMNGDV